MTDEQKKQFQIHLPGLLKVLAESLYSSKKVGIRELIQNAHDSCVRRQVEDKRSNFKPQIEIFINLRERKIIIQDNGSGLTEDEVTEYLSTIGRSYTRQLGENLAILSPDEASKLVGQFGLGFLSAFLIAEDVTLTTLSYKPDSKAIRWRSTGDVHYNVSEVTDEDTYIGTKVELTVKPEARFLLNERVMVDTVRAYADFLDIPVFVGDNDTPINSQQTPWNSIDPDIAIKDYVHRVFGYMNPLAIIPLSDQEVAIGNDDTITIPLEGFLFVPPGSVASIQEYGTVNIYIRRMFITEKHPRLLPSWAKFVLGVVDCPYLQPTASREDIQQDDMFLKVQKALEEQLIAGLKKIAVSDPSAWKKVVRGHRNLIISWAIKDENFFNDIADIITFQTPQGQKTLPEYLKDTDDKIYYVTREIGSKQDQLLGEGYGVPVIDAAWGGERIFLENYARRNRHVKLVQMDSESNQLLQPVPEDEFASILAYYRGQRIKARMVTFKPSDLPAIINYPRDAEFIKETRDALDKGDLPAPFAGLVGDYVNSMDVGEDMLAGTLHLNAASPLIKHLANLPENGARNAALELVYQMARLLNGRMLDTDDITHAFKMAAASILNLVDDNEDE